jgi:hypothetical protein
LLVTVAAVIDPSSCIALTSIVMAVEFSMSMVASSMIGMAILSMRCIPE